MLTLMILADYEGSDHFRKKKIAGFVIWQYRHLHIPHESCTKDSTLLFN